MKRKLGLVLTLLTLCGAFVQNAHAYYNVYDYSGNFMYTIDPNNNPEYEGDLFRPRPHPGDEDYRDPYAN